MNKVSFALAMFFLNNSNHARRVAEAGFLCTEITGKKPKGNAAIIAAIHPAIEAGYIKVQTIAFTPKGCPGGKSRPAIAYVDELSLTQTGLDLVASLQTEAKAEWDRRADAARQKAIKFLEIELPKLDATRLRNVLVFGQVQSLDHLDSATTPNLDRMVTMVERWSR